MSIMDSIRRKLNPVQDEIARDEGTRVSSTQTKLNTISNAY